MAQHVTLKSVKITS